MNNKKTLLWLFIASGVVALSAHAFFFYQWGHGQFMVGPHDGTEQMLAFKQFLFEQYKNGAWFYAYDFGLGGGTYSQLAYYFSTNVLFLITCIAIYVGQWLGFFAHADTVVFWGQAAVFVSAFRLAIVIFTSALVFRYMRASWRYAFVGAVLYGVSLMYFRHVSFWEFFADAYVWLPLLVLGVEKIIREQKPTWLIVAVALTLINNFYFAYMNLIFIGLYALMRLIIRFPNDQATRSVQIRFYIPALLLGFMVASVAFIPAVHGFLQNYRPSFSEPIAAFTLQDNLLYSSKLWLIPAIFLVLILIRTLYKHKPFFFFAILTGLFVIFHYSPLIGSAFNGFSAPQFRFEYMGSFAVAGAVVFGLPKLRATPKKTLLISLIITSTLFLFAFFTDATNWRTEQQLWTIVVFTIVTLFCVWQRSQRALITILILGTLVISNVYQSERLFVNGNIQKTSRSYLERTAYGDHTPSELIHKALMKDNRPLPRTEWIADVRNNTPLVQHFDGNSVYSSILTKHLLFLYYRDLQITMNRESLSRYYGFGDRANLHSLFQTTYKLVDPKEDTPIPYGFVLKDTNDQYHLYENELVLPFARVATAIYSEEDLAELSMLEREHAMLTGVIARDEIARDTYDATATDKMPQATIHPVGGTYEDGVLTVTEKKGGIDIKVGERAENEVDDYLSFYLKNRDATAPLFPLTVNEFETSRKSLKSIYKTEENHLTIRVQSSDTLSLRVPKGSYDLRDFQLYSESYDLLREASETNEPLDVSISNHHLHVTVPNAKDGSLLTVPVPYEKGWEVTVNGEKADLEQVNYAFLGVQLSQGDNEVRFSYLPPFFRLSVGLSSAGLILAMLWHIYRKKKTPQ
ncbi:YfhO family protein [Bacillus sp. FSL W7-1360]